MDNTFNLAFSIIYFDGMRHISSQTVNADSIETVKENAFKIIYENLKAESYDDDGDYYTWMQNIERVNINVSEVSE